MMLKVFSTRCALNHVSFADLQVLELEYIDANLYRGLSPEAPRWGRIYGGQTISQAIVAAAKTVPEPSEVVVMDS